MAKKKKPTPTPPAEKQVEIIIKPSDAAEARWQKITDALLNRRRSVAHDLLQYYFDVGNLAADVVAAKSKTADQRLVNKYGKRTIDELAKALEVSDSTVYLCLRFGRTFDRQQLAELQKNEWPWRSVITLMTVENIEERREKQLEYQAGEHREHGEAWKDYVESYNQKQRAAGKRKDNRGRKSAPPPPIKGAHTIINQLVKDILPDLLVGVKDLGDNADNHDAKKVAEAKVQLREIDKGLEAIAAVATKFREMVAELGL